MFGGFQRSVVLFCRAPEAEARAKGLAPAAAAVFEAFLRSWSELAAAAEATLTVVAPRASLVELRRLLPGATCTRQIDGAFGARLVAAVADLRTSASWPVVVAGGDAPPPPLTTLLEIFAHLEASDGLALVPADDGGVNAFGLSRPVESLVESVDWHTSRVYQQLATRGAALGLRVLATRSAPDLDSSGDAARLLCATRHDADWRQFRWVLLDLVRLALPGGASPVPAVHRLTWSRTGLRGPPASNLA